MGGCIVDTSVKSQLQRIPSSKLSDPAQWPFNTPLIDFKCYQLLKLSGPGSVGMLQLFFEYVAYVYVCICMPVLCIMHSASRAHIIIIFPTRSPQSTDSMDNLGFTFKPALQDISLKR